MNGVILSVRHRFQMTADVHVPFAAFDVVLQIQLDGLATLSSQCRGSRIDYNLPTCNWREIRCWFVTLALCAN